MNIMRLMAYFPAMQICLSRDIPTSPRLLYPPLYCISAFTVLICLIWPEIIHPDVMQRNMLKHKN